MASLLSSDAFGGQDIFSLPVICMAFLSSKATRLISSVLDLLSLH